MKNIILFLACSLFTLDYAYAGIGKSKYSAHEHASSLRQDLNNLIEKAKNSQYQDEKVLNEILAIYYYFPLGDFLPLDIDFLKNGFNKVSSPQSTHVMLNFLSKMKQLHTLDKQELQSCVAKTKYSDGLADFLSSLVEFDQIPLLGMELFKNQVDSLDNESLQPLICNIFLFKKVPLLGAQYVKDLITKLDGKEVAQLFWDERSLGGLMCLGTDFVAVQFDKLNPMERKEVLSVLFQYRFNVFFGAEFIKKQFQQMGSSNLLTLARKIFSEGLLSQEGVITQDLVKKYTGKDLKQLWPENIADLVTKSIITTLSDKDFKQLWIDGFEEKIPILREHICRIPAKERSKFIETCIENCYEEAVYKGLDGLPSEQMFQFLKRCISKKSFDTVVADYILKLQPNQQTLLLKQCIQEKTCEEAVKKAMIKLSPDARMPYLKDCIKNHFLEDIVQTYTESLKPTAKKELEEFISKTNAFKKNKAAEIVVAESEPPQIQIAEKFSVSPKKKKGKKNQSNQPQIFNTEDEDSKSIITYTESSATDLADPYVFEDRFCKMEGEKYPEIPEIEQIPSGDISVRYCIDTWNRHINTDPEFNPVTYKTTENNMKIFLDHSGHHFISSRMQRKLCGNATEKKLKDNAEITYLKSAHLAMDNFFANENKRMCTAFIVPEEEDSLPQNTKIWYLENLITNSQIIDEEEFEGQKSVIYEVQNPIQCMEIVKNGAQVMLTQFETNTFNCALQKDRPALLTVYPVQEKDEINTLTSRLGTLTLRNE